MDVTIFTPTYNREKLIKNLYHSLMNQTNFNFEWIVVDDGSVDNTELFFKELQKKEQPFKLTYLKQTNAGKHVAINKGVQIANTDIFFIVDSDDYLPNDSVATILQYWDEVKNDSDFAGIVLNKSLPSGSSVGNPRYSILDCSPIDFRYKFNEKGDKAEVIRTKHFKKNPFPETVGEKFCPEALFFNRLFNYKLRYINKSAYICEYLPDGLTANNFSIRKNSPLNTCMTYSELANYNLPFLQTLKAMINFYRFERYSKSRVVPVFKNRLLSSAAKLLADMIYILKDRKL